jgi:peroxiredoxin Q/BCP
MRGVPTLLLTICVAISSLSAASDLKVGDVAPQFSLAGSDGKSYSLAGYKGKQVVVLAWFAKAFTGG